MNITLDQNDEDKIRGILIGRKVTKVSDNKLLLDNGITLTLNNGEGGCSCSAGDYDLTELNGVDNIITAVELNNDPAGDDYPNGEGVYQIFVYADNQKINLATWCGTDGNGYYGTGYSITVSGVTQ